MTKTALITGITGQDGAYLAELLLDKGYIVHGIKRRTSLFNTERIDHLYEDPHDPRPALRPALRRPHRFVEPRPRDAAGAAGRGLQPRRAESRGGFVRGAGIHGQFGCDGHVAPARSDPHPRAWRARRASIRRRPPRCSDWSAKRRRRRRRRSTRVRPTVWRSSTATGSPSTTASRTASTPATASCSITNRRFAARPSSLARSPARSRASCSASRSASTSATSTRKRDWGHAKDYVRAMWLMLQQPSPEDFVIATGEQHSVREFVTAAATEAGVELAWEGADADEVGRVAKVAPGRSDTLLGKVIVRIDRRYFRPAEVDTLLGDADARPGPNSAGNRKFASPSWSRKWCAKTCAWPSAMPSSSGTGTRCTSATMPSANGSPPHDVVCDLDVFGDDECARMLVPPPVAGRPPLRGRRDQRIAKPDLLNTRCQVQARRRMCGGSLTASTVFQPCFFISSRMFSASSKLFSE